jgi:hypothetical protein
MTTPESASSSPAGTRRRRRERDRAAWQRYRRPVVVEVLPVLDIQHAIARAADDEFNKGIEAAAAALEMIAWRRSIGA